MHILIVTHFYPPLNAIASLRPRSFARYFAAQGHRVTVLTTQKSLTDGNLDLDAYVHPNIKVIEVPYKPLFFWQKESAAAPAPVSNDNKAANNKGIKAKVAGTLKAVLHSMGYLIDRQRFWVRPAFQEACQVMQQEKIDVVLSTFAPPAAHVLASKIVARYPQVKWIADYRDLWSQNHLMPTKGIFKTLERRIEKKTIARADHLTTVSEPLVADLLALTQNRIPASVIYNGFDTDIEIPEVQKRPELSLPLRIVYTGVIYKNRRDPAPLLNALRELKKEGMLKSGDVQVDFYGNANANLQEIVDQCQAAEWTNIKGYVSYKEALGIQQSADYLLFLESNAKDARGVLTGKLFEYLIAGKPILGVGIDEHCASGQVIRDTRTGAVFGTDTTLIKEYFRSLFTAKTDTAYNPDWKKVQEYSREKQAEKLLNIIKEQLNKAD